jgi:hypothetical protein
MKKLNYTRYKRYEREGGLVEWLIRTRHKLPRGSAGRPEKQPGLWVRQSTVTNMVHWAWFGDGFDPALCEAMVFAHLHESPAVRKEAQLVILDGIKRAMESGDRAIFHQLAKITEAVGTPQKPVIVALLLAWKSLTGKDRAIYCKTKKDLEKLPTPTDLGKEAGKFFSPSGNDYVKKSQDYATKSLKVSLSRSSKVVRGLMTYQDEADFSPRTIGLTIKP